MIHSIFNRFITTLIPLLPLSFVRMIARRYVAGESSQEALKIVQRLNENGYSVTLDILGEHSKNKPEAQSITNKYSDLYEKIHNLQHTHFVFLKEYLINHQLILTT